MNNQQGSGGRTLAMGQKRDGPNWVMIAGGAIVMAVSIVLGRKQIQSQGERLMERVLNTDRAQQSNHNDSREPSSRGRSVSNGTARQQLNCPRNKELSEDTFSPDQEHVPQAYRRVPRATIYWDGLESPVSSQAHFEFHSSKSKRPPPTPPSPPTSKLCRQLADDSVTPLSSGDHVQSDTYTSSALRAGLSARREMVHRLRQQLRSRDAVIFDMQAQISDQDQLNTMLRAHSADLQECLEDTSTKLFEANLEVQRLRSELMAHFSRAIRNFGDYGYGVSEPGRRTINTDVKAIILEARRLTEEVKRLEGEKQSRETVSQAMSQQCELLCKKVSTLEMELEEVKTSALGNQSLLETKEQEIVKLSTALEDLQHRLDMETRDSEWTRNNKVSRVTDARSANSRGKWSRSTDPPVSCNTHDDVSSNYTGVAESSSQRAGNLMRSYNTLFTRSSNQPDSDESASKARSRSNTRGHPSKRVAHGIQDSEATDYEDGEVISESLVLTLQQEVDQLSSALATRSKVVSEKMQETSRVLTEFQKHLNTPDAYANEQTAPEERDWADLSQVLSFSPDGTSAEQIQELSHKLEQVTKQQHVEEEIKELSRHQARITELKSRVAKLTAKCHVRHAQTSQGDTSNEQALRVAVSISDLADKLAAQEEQAKETSKEVQRLSASFQLSSPYVPRSKKQELRRLLQETSKQTESPASGSVHKKQILSSPSPPNAKLRYVPQEQNLEETKARFLERQMSFSSLQRSSRVTPPSEKLLDQPYQFQLGACDPVPTSKTRRGGSYGAGRSSLRKPGTHHDSGVGSKRQANLVGRSAVQRSHGVGFSPEEVSSGFSFGLSAKDRPLKNFGISGADGNARAASKQARFGRCDWAMEAEDSGLQHEVMVETAAVARMGSPVPGTQYSPTRSGNHSPVFSSSPFPSFYENFASTCDSNPSPALNSMLCPVLDDKFSPAVRVGSPTVSGSVTPCFGSSETSLRRFLFRSDRNSPIGVSSISCLGGNSDDDTTTELRKLLFNADTEKVLVSNDGDSEAQIKRSTEEDSPSLKAYTNPGCSRSVGVSPFAARMAYLDVKQPASPVGSLRDFELWNQRFSLAKEEAEEGSSGVHWNLMGQENSMEDRHPFSEGLAPVSHMVPIKDEGEGSAPRATIDLEQNGTLDHNLRPSAQVCSNFLTLDKSTAPSAEILHTRDAQT